MRETAARVRVLRVGEVTLALDGTKILACASKHSAVSHGHALRQMVLLEEQIAELLTKADAADSTPLDDGLTVPEEIARRRDRIEKLRERAERQKAMGKKPRGREPRIKTTSPTPRAAG